MIAATPEPSKSRLNTFMHTYISYGGCSPPQEWSSRWNLAGSRPPPRKGVVPHSWGGAATYNLQKAMKVPPVGCGGMWWYATVCECFALLCITFTLHFALLSVVADACTMLWALALPPQPYTSVLQVPGPPPPPRNGMVPIPGGGGAGTCNLHACIYV